MSRTAAGVALAVLLAGAYARAQSPDEVAVFDAVLGHFAADQQGNSSFLVFSETTVVRAWNFGHMGEWFPQELLKGLLAANASSSSIDGYSPPKPFRCATPRQLGDVLTPGGCCDWPAFRSRFPDAAGVLRLSWPAYSPDGLLAMVYVETGCGLDCAAGRLYLLSRADGAWRVIESLVSWIA